MNVIKGVILFVLLIFVNNQVPDGKVINSCGIVGYNRPNKAEDCIQDGEYCCYVVLKKDSNEKAFCATAPSKITQADIEEDIKSFTDYTLEQLDCNNSNFINILNFLLLLSLFILF